jgi:chromosome segregation ATPase
MPIDHDRGLFDRLHDLERRLDRALDLLARVSDDLSQVAQRGDTLEAGLTEVKTDLQRGFSDLRHAVRHVGVRVGEGDRHRGR